MDLDRGNFVHWFLIFHSRPLFGVPMESDIRVIRESHSQISFGNLTLPSRSDNAIYDFSKKAVENGLDIFRVFDSLNYFGEC